MPVPESSIIVRTPVIDSIGELYTASGLGKKSVLLFDENTRKLFGDEIIESMHHQGFRTCELVVPARETSKSVTSAWKLYGQMIEAEVDRGWNLLCIGGGVVGDLGGYIAASYYRGIPVVQLPTTLLAMTDSSIGGKVAINHPLGKNLIGFFHLPKLVLIDPANLRSLPMREIYAGMAEVVKYGFIADRSFFDLLVSRFDDIVRLQEPWISEAVSRSAFIKADVVEKDFRETSGLRATLNFGHTFAHGLEKLAEYRNLRHGEAVTLGMACALFLSNRLGFLEKTGLEEGLELIGRFRFPRGLINRRFLSLEREELFSSMYSDKKKIDRQLRFVLLDRISHAFLHDQEIEKESVLQSIDDAKGWFSEKRE
ncbi:MAG: 3-dehydroquinate synthase [Chlorobiaceae bacterium]|nr:3-dehydroquinate synthase [Chlorobiaceae bacterium]